METFSALLAICGAKPPVNSPHKGQWRGALMFSLICAWINGWVNTREADELRRHRAHYDVTVMISQNLVCHICHLSVAQSFSDFAQQGSVYKINGFSGRTRFGEIWVEMMVGYSVLLWRLPAHDGARPSGGQHTFVFNLKVDNIIFVKISLDKFILFNIRLHHPKWLTKSRNTSESWYTALTYVYKPMYYYNLTRLVLQLVYSS